MSDYQVVARNFSSASENKIHNDDIARKLGFRGALVPGVAVYGHMTYPLVHQFGADWLGHSVDSLRLLKPAYDGERLTVSLSSDRDHCKVSCHNPHGELLAELTSATPDKLPDPEHLGLLDADYKDPARVEINWHTVTPHQAFAPWALTITDEQNRTYTERVSDPLGAYADGLAHPHLLQSLANTALVNEYIMPAWIHVGTETRHRAALRVGDAITVRSAVLDKWQKKDHEFIQVYVTLWRGNDLTTDMLHTAIFKVAA